MSDPTLHTRYLGGWMGTATPTLDMTRPSAITPADPDRIAVTSPDDDRAITHAEFERRTRRLAAALHMRGLAVGDVLALALPNSIEYLEVAWAALRAGLYCVPVNTHLTRSEAAYILANCGARCVVMTASLAVQWGLEEADAEPLAIRLCVDSKDGAVGSFVDYEDVIGAGGPESAVDAQQGQFMYYSSGTTGRPKGIKRRLPRGGFGSAWPMPSLLQQLYDFDSRSIFLNPAPMYHTAPTNFCLTTLWLGGTVVVMKSFDARRTVELIDSHAVTHVQFVPTHMMRILQLPPEVRARYATSTLKAMITAAAPCSPELKDRVAAWAGPVLYEYFGASEFVGLCAISPGESATHRGSVGRSLLGPVYITDEDGNELAPGEVGQVWFGGSPRFEYHGDPEKTRKARGDRGRATTGDIGYLDDDGYLYLTARVGDMIVSGGVNVYPTEVEQALQSSPLVSDAGVVGLPDPDLGEVVAAFVELSDGIEDTPETRRSLLAHCRAHLAGFKCPKQVHIITGFPRTPTGKLLRGELRSRVSITG